MAPASRKRSATANNVPKLIDDKRKHLEKALSAGQRDQILLAEAKEEIETRRDLAKSLRYSTDSFNAALNNISGSMFQLDNSICHAFKSYAFRSSASCKPKFILPTQLWSVSV